MTDETPKLSADEWRVIAPILQGLRRKVDQKLYQPTGLVNETFADDFALRLRLFHATHTPEEALTKKAFEYAFGMAARTANHQVKIAPSSTSAASDVFVDGEGYALKTEADKNIRADSVTISKLMESAWTKECRDCDAFADGVRKHIVPRLKHSKYVFVLRAHGRLGIHGRIRYELIEIPLDVLLAMEDVTAKAFSGITRAGGTKCPVFYQGNEVFTLVFDGSDQKITIRNLRVDVLRKHAEWTLYEE